MIPLNHHGIDIGNLITPHSVSYIVTVVTSISNNESTPISKTIQRWEAVRIIPFCCPDIQRNYAWGQLNMQRHVVAVIR